MFKVIRKFRFFFNILLGAFLLCSIASLAEGSSSTPFSLHAIAEDSQTVVVIWNIAPGNYLYRDHIYFAVKNSITDQISHPLWPETHLFKEYPGTGKLPVYEETLKITIPVTRHAHPTITLQVKYQGCSDQGVCFPPEQKSLVVDLSKNYGTPVYPSAVKQAGKNGSSATPSALSSQDKAAQLLKTHNIFLALLSFFIFGLLISLTPCVLPLVPILSAILVGQEHRHTGRALGLSLCYVLGMALAYAALGFAFGFMGSRLQESFQQPWVLILLSIILILFALSLFDLYNLQLPSSWQNRIAQITNRPKGGSYVGTALMGFFSLLIVSPCVTPALVGALGYISQTGNTGMGGLALFFMGLGMGVPLVVIGALSKQWLPKAGSWMNTIKYFLGLLLLGLAIFILSRLLPGFVVLILWGALAIAAAFILGAFTSAHTAAKQIQKVGGIVLFIYGILLVLGGGLRHSDPLNPLNFKNTSPETSAVSSPTLQFIPVKTNSDIEKQLKIAASQNKIILLDFYADWCLACHELEKNTFQNIQVQSALQSFYLLRADVTKNDADDKALQKKYNILGPPTLVFLSSDGTEIPSTRLVGTLSAKAFLKHLKKIESQ